LVDSEAYSGGNVTGFVVLDLSIGGKWTQLLREIAPELTRIGVIYNPHTAAYAPPLIALAKAAAGSDVAVIVCSARDDSEIEAKAFWSRLGRSPTCIATGSLRYAPGLTWRSLPVSGATEREALLCYTFAFDPILEPVATSIDS
jgi:hypothetical protein